MNNFYEGLVEYWDGEYLPCLATDWAASDDGLTYTCLLYTSSTHIVFEEVHS